MTEKENIIIINKKYINPIITPLTCFIDKFYNINSLFSMNPSLFITKYGDVYILLRNINYRKFQDKQFIIYGDYSVSTYFLLKGNIDDHKPLNLDFFTIDDVNVYYNKDTHNTYWKGIEDIRFISEDTVLVIVPELNVNGNPSIFKASFDPISSNIYSFNDCYPNYIEKNWMPYIDDNNKEKVIYSLYPLKIKSIEEDDTKEICTLIDLKNYHGSSNGILYRGNYRLFLIHRNKERVYNAFILFDPTINDIILSKPFVFFKHSFIEFACSLSMYNERIFVSLGVNDSSAYIIELEKNVIDDLFIQI
jgi:hypothetical protein